RQSHCYDARLQQPSILTPLFFFNPPAPTETYTLSLHDALPISTGKQLWSRTLTGNRYEGVDMTPGYDHGTVYVSTVPVNAYTVRSEEHTSELQSLAYLVCRLLLEKKKK